MNKNTEATETAISKTLEAQAAKLDREATKLNRKLGERLAAIVQGARASGEAEARRKVIDFEARQARVSEIQGAMVGQGGKGENAPRGQSGATGGNVGDGNKGEQGEGGNVQGETYAVKLSAWLMVVKASGSKASNAKAFDNWPYAMVAKQGEAGIVEYMQARDVRLQGERNREQARNETFQAQRNAQFQAATRKAFNETGMIEFELITGGRYKATRQALLAHIADLIASYKQGSGYDAATDLRILEAKGGKGEADAAMVKGDTRATDAQRVTGAKQRGERQAEAQRQAATDAKRIEIQAMRELSPLDTYADALAKLAAMDAERQRETIRQQAREGTRMRMRFDAEI